METKPATEAIRIVLDGAEVTLVPSIHAADKLSRKHLGLVTLIESLRSGSLAAATDVVFYALSKHDSERTRVEQQVRAAGLVNLIPPLTQYVDSMLLPKSNEISTLLMQRH